MQANKKQQKTQHCKQGHSAAVIYVGGFGGYAGG